MGINVEWWTAPSTLFRLGALFIVVGLLGAVLDLRWGLEGVGFGALFVIIGLLKKYRGQRKP